MYVSIKFQSALSQHHNTMESVSTTAPACQAMNGGEGSKDCEIVLIYKCVYLGPVHECYQPIIHCDYDVSRPDSALVSWTVSGHSLYDQMKTSIQTKTENRVCRRRVSHNVSCKNVSLSHIEGLLHQIIM